MNNKNCEEIMNSYLLLDKDEKVPLKIFLHLFFEKQGSRDISQATSDKRPQNLTPPILSLPLSPQSHIL